MKQYRILSLSLMFLSACGVEAGNPTGKKPKGSATVSLVPTSSVTGDQFTISIDSISLVSSDETSSSAQSMAISNQDFNLLSSSPNATGAEAAKSDVDTGKYTGVIITLPERRPPRYRPAGGDESELGTDKLDQHGFRIDQEIQIKEGESTNIVIRIDPLSSISKDGGQLRFDPRCDAFPRPPEAQYSGTAPITDAAYVCAYGYGLTRMQPPPQSNSTMGIPPPPPPPGPGGKFAAKSHQVFATKADVLFDSSSTCMNAFTKTGIKGSSFILDRLLPGSYALRFFRADDTYVDLTTDISVSAP